MDGRLASLVLTRNRSRILSCRPVHRGSDRLDLRLHASFATAETGILKTVALYALGRFGKAQRRGALAILRRYFETHGNPGQGARPTRRPPAVRLDPLGRSLDLRNLRDRLNEAFFEGRIEVDITWGRALPRTPRRRAARRTLRLGSFDGTRNLIRIHRVLDDPQVPGEVVEAVVYHEMLHADLPAILRGGRRYSHTPEFRRREKLLPTHLKAEAWLEEQLPYLLSARLRRC